MDTGLLSLKWNNHSSTFFHVLETIRRKELYSDVTIACDGKFFSVHKLVLSTCSEYFQEMFERTQCKHPIIVLKDINHKDLESLLNYMYIGEVNVIQTELSSLIKAAECLKVKGLAVPDEPPPRKSNKRPSDRDRDEGSQIKRNRRSGSSSSSMLNQVQSASLVEGSMPSETLPIAPSPRRTQESEMVDSAEKERRLGLRPEDHSSHNFKDLETTIKVEKEDAPPEPYVEDGLPPVTKFEYGTSPGDSTMESGLDDTNETSYTSHLQPPTSEDSMGHLIPSTSRYGESSSWPSEMEGMDDGGDKEEGGEGANYDPNTFLLDNPQAQGKSQMAYRNDFENFNAPSSISEITRSFMEKEDTHWKCSFPGCSFAHYNKSNVLRHVRQHTGERPFVCHICDYRSNQSTHLRRHIISVHHDQLSQLDSL